MAELHQEALLDVKASQGPVDQDDVTLFAVRSLCDFVNAGPFQDLLSEGQQSGYGGDYLLLAVSKDIWRRFAEEFQEFDDRWQSQQFVVHLFRMRWGENEHPTPLVHLPQGKRVFVVGQSQLLALVKAHVARAIERNREAIIEGVEVVTPVDSKELVREGVYLVEGQDLEDLWCLDIIGGSQDWDLMIPRRAPTDLLCDLFDGLFWDLE